MPKKSSPFLSSKQFTGLMVLPWAHFGMLKSGVFERDYAFTLAGTFNIVGAVANRKKNREIETEVSAVQLVVAQLLAEARCPTESEVQQIAKALQAADRYLARQPKHDLVQSILYVERCIAEGRAKGIPHASI